MKHFEYVWPQDTYLIHYEMNTEKSKTIEYTIIRYNSDGTKTINSEKVVPVEGTFRSIISKCSIDEYRVDIEYSDSVVMKVYLVYDRAFYPTVPFFQE